MKRLIFILILLASCSQLPKGETCYVVEKIQGSNSIATSHNFQTGQPTIILIGGTNKTKYRCSNGIDYWINE